LTQKDKSKFEERVQARLEEVHLLELTVEEMEGRGSMHYCSGHTFEPKHTSVKADKTGARCFVVDTHPDNGRNFMHDPANRSRKLGNTHVELDLTNFILDLQDQVNLDIPKLKLLTLHRRNGMIFRGCASFRGGVWRDWVVADWGQGFKKMHSHTWGLVDLSKLRKISRINIGGVNNLQPGVYAAVESSKHVENPSNTELITEIEIDVAGFSDGFVSKLVFYLAPVEAFVAPAIAVPNIGGKNNAYMWLKPRHTWFDMFVKWLHEPYRFDNLSDSEVDGTEDEVDEGGEDHSVAGEEPEEEEEDTDLEEEDSEAELEAKLEANLQHVSKQWYVLYSILRL